MIHDSISSVHHSRRIKPSINSHVSVNDAEKSGAIQVSRSDENLNNSNRIVTRIFPNAIAPDHTTDSQQRAADFPIVVSQTEMATSISNLEASDHMTNEDAAAQEATRKRNMKEVAAIEHATKIVMLKAAYKNACGKSPPGAKCRDPTSLNKNIQEALAARSAIELEANLTEPKATISVNNGHGVRRVTFKTTTIQVADYTLNEGPMGMTLNSY
jgi:hypothetical protein